MELHARLHRLQSGISPAPSLLESQFRTGGRVSHRCTSRPVRNRHQSIMIFHSNSHHGIGVD